MSFRSCPDQSFQSPTKPGLQTLRSTTRRSGVASVKIRRRRISNSSRVAFIPSCRVVHRLPLSISASQCRWVVVATSKGISTSRIKAEVGSGTRSTRTAKASQEKIWTKRLLTRHTCLTAACINSTSWAAWPEHLAEEQKGPMARGLVYLTERRSWTPAFNLRQTSLSWCGGTNAAWRALTFLLILCFSTCRLWRGTIFSSSTRSSRQKRLKTDSNVT